MTAPQTSSPDGDATSPGEEPAIPPVIASIPRALGAVDVLVRHQSWGVEVDVRPMGTAQAWRPIALMGGSFTVRPS